VADTGFTSQTTPTPASWGEVFAMLPAANAPAGAWARIAARLSAPAASTPRPAQRRWRPALALAASVALAGPVAWWLTSADDVPEPALRVAATTGGDAPVVAAVDGAAASRPPALANAPSGATVSTPLATVREDAGRIDEQGRPRSVANAPAIRTGRAAPRPTPAALPARVAEPPSVAATTSGSVAGSDTVATAPDATGTGDALQRLRGESARLEALVAFARDDRVASGAATLMTGALDDRLRLIDAALSQADLAEPVRASLWSQRVDALHELATLEGTRRWMAVHGTSLDAVARVD
jgi:hypothetical protein